MMVDMKTEQTLLPGVITEEEAARSLFRRWGMMGGLVKTPKKKAASRLNVAKAREVRAAKIAARKKAAMKARKSRGLQ